MRAIRCRLAFNPPMAL